MAGDWTKICQGTKITDLLTSSPNTDLAKFEDVLCKMNWTKILIELGENQDVDVQLFTQKVNQFGKMAFHIWRKVNHCAKHHLINKRFNFEYFK